MGAFKGIEIKTPKIDSPHIVDLKPIELPRLIIARDQAFPIAGEAPSVSLAKVAARRREMTITPNLSNNSGVKYFDLSRTETKSRGVDTPKLEMAAGALMVGLGVLILNTEIISWVERYAQAIVTFFGMMALPIFGMVAGGGGSKKAPDPVLSSIAEELRDRAGRLEETAESEFDKRYHNYASYIARAQKLREEAEHVLRLTQTETLSTEGWVFGTPLEKVSILSSLESRGPGVFHITTEARFRRIPWGEPLYSRDLVGYELTADQGDGKVSLLINITDRSSVERIHQIFVNRVQKLGSAQATLRWFQVWMLGYFDLSLLEVKNPANSFSPHSPAEIRSRYPNQVFPWESVISYSTTSPFVIEHTTSEGHWTQYDFSSTQLPALRLTNEDRISEGDKRVRISDPRLEDADVTLSRTSDGRFSVFNKKGKVYILRKSSFKDSEEKVLIKFPIQEGHASFENSELQNLDLKTDTLVINKIVFKFRTKENEGSPSHDDDSPSPGLEISHFTNHEDFKAAYDALENGKLDPKTIFWEGFSDHAKEDYVFEIYTIGTLNRDNLKTRVKLYTRGFLENERKPDSWESFGLMIDTPSPLTYDSEFYGDTWSTHILIKTKDPLIAKAIHQQFADEYLKTGSARAAIDWLRRRPEAPELFEIPPMIGEEEKLPEDTVQWLKEFGGTGTNLSAIEGALKDPSPLIRRSAAEALGIVGGPEEVLHTLVALLFERDTKVKAILVSAFKSLKEREPESLSLINSFFRELQSNTDLTPDDKKVFLRYLKASVEDENP